MTNPITIRGALTWNSRERRSDRYGSIGLQQEAVDVNAGLDSPAVRMDAFKPLVGKRARLTATVVVTGDSCHIGDLFRGIGPSKTPVGEVLDLGVGQVVAIDESDDMISLVFCRDGRQDENDWMDPNQLYRLHDHVVDLTLVETLPS